jgi:hypothetical protein
MAQFNRQQTVLEIIQNALGQMGLGVPAAAYSDGANDTAQQCIRLLQSRGRRLVKPTGTNRWQALRKTWICPTDPIATTYSLPADWDSFEDMTGWNFTSRLPMLGPASDPQWMTLKARNLGSSTISVIYRVRDDVFEIYNTFPTAQELRIDYSSRGWVKKSGTPPTYQDFIDGDDNLCLYDGDLLTAALKMDFLGAKGFDTTVATAEYQELLDQALNADSDAPVLNISVSGAYPLISTQFNTPDTGYGG